jgi:hypothetical protein
MRIGTSTMSLRARRILLRVGVHSAVLAPLLLFSIISGLAGDDGMAAFFAIGFVLYVVTLRVNPLPNFLELKLFQEAECSFCGQRFELTGTWSCRCGFVTWEPRYALFPCPHCKGVFEWLDCPRCGASIVV